VLEERANPAHPLTARFIGIDLYWPSPLELIPPPGVSGEILFTSTEHAWLQTRDFITNPELISRFEDEAEETRGVQTLGVALYGLFPSAFENGLPGIKPGRIIVVGNTDFAGPLMQFNRGGERNLEFLVRAAEWIISDDDLLTIRSRERIPGRLDRITDRDRRDAIMTFSRTVNTIIIPLGVVLFGTFMVWRRNQRTMNREQRREKRDSGEL
jgi:ABC-type uncharacterized transport system involved in gliding motility auxiliary subunit